MKQLITLTALFALAVPAAFAAPPAGKGGQSAAQGGTAAAQSSVPSPAQQCRELLRTMGASDFRSTYGTGNGANAMGKCVSRLAQASSADADNAAKRCKAERAANPEAFKQKYGTNPNKANAFGKCVSALAGEAAEERQDAIENAAKRCKAERAANPEAFKQKYGTNPNKANAFGKCVSRSVKTGS